MLLFARLKTRWEWLRMKKRWQQLRQIHEENLGVLAVLAAVLCPTSTSTGR